MSEITNKYDEYLSEHIANVKKAYNYIKQNLPELLEDLDMFVLDKQIKNHDKSKYSEDEYEAYANYFYGKKTADVKKAFDLAWLHHQKENPHHWQYWILINDEDGTTELDIPYNYIIEMICDWWAFSWKSGDLYEIFDWYKKQDMQLNTKTKTRVENILTKIRNYLDDFVPDTVEN